MSSSEATAPTYRPEDVPEAVIEEAERLLGYWEHHGNNAETVTKWAVSDLLDFVRLVLDPSHGTV